MSETAAAAPATATPLPLFFHSVVGVNAEQHGQLRLDRASGYAFAAGSQAIPLGLGELDIAAQHYPIVFTTGSRPVPMALLSLRQGHNAFVLPDGAWRPDSYVPAYVRAFPFVFVEDQANKTLYVAMEPSAAAISQTEGAALFEDGKPSPALNDAVSFCATFRDNVASGAAFALALDQAGLLEEEEATINFTAGGNARVTGFKVLKPERLEQVADATYLEWRRKGWIAGLYAHLHSTARWARLVEVTTQA